MVYDISYKTLIGVKPLRIVDEFSRVYDWTRYLVLFRCEKYHSIFNIIRYLIRVKSSIAYVISYNYAKIEVDLYDSLPLGKTLTFHDVIILIKAVFNKDKNNYYYNIFIEQAS